jgi:BolA family transcriptional regulator, general stress-responsive regulator
MTLSDLPKARAVDAGLKSHGSLAMQALVVAFSDALNEEGALHSEAPPPLPAPTGAPPLGSVMQLAKETGKSRDACKAALVANANDYETARLKLLKDSTAGTASEVQIDAGARARTGPMTIAEAITAKLRHTFDPMHLEVINESSRHSVRVGSETHFKVIIISRTFDGAKLLDRHRAVNDCLAHELANGVHALSITAKTPAQWETSSTVPLSPECMSGVAEK